MNIISGEKFKEICDLNIIYKDSIKTKKNGKEVIFFEDFFQEKTNVKNVYFCTHIIYDDKFLEKLRLIKCKFNLILHNSDHHFKKQHLDFFNKFPNLQKIYTQNCEVEDNRVIPIPIGIANSAWTHGNLEIFNKVLSEEIEKNKEIYFHFNISTNRKERGECVNKLKRKKIKWIPSTDYQNYLRILKSHKFAISPQGNGVDCHRLWECLYMKVVPICKKSFLTEYFSKTFPIIVLEDWNDLNIETLNYKNYSWENYDKLGFQWWKTKIL